MVDDPPSIDVEPSEKSPVQDGAHYLVTALIGCLRGFHECQGVPEDLLPAVEVSVSIGQRVFDLGALVPDGVDLGPQLVLGPTLLGSQIEEVVLLPVECVKLLNVLVAECLAEPVLASGRFVHAGPYLSEPVGWQAHDIAVVAYDRLFQDLYRDEGEVAQSLLAAAAEEVEVLAAVASLGALDHQPVLAAWLWLR